MVLAGGAAYISWDLCAQAGMEAMHVACTPCMLCVWEGGVLCVTGALSPWQNWGVKH